MLPENIRDIQQRLHELNAEEARLLANIQVSLAGIERVHAQRRMEELTLVELQGKAEEDRRGREDMKPRQKKKKKGKQGNQGNQGQPGNQKRGAEEQPERPESAKRQRQGGSNNAYGGQGGQGIPVPIPGPSSHGNWNQGQNQSLPGGECKCSRVDVHCGGNGSTCQVCKALGCAGIVQSHYRNQVNNEHHGNVPGTATLAPSTWPHDTASIMNIDALDSHVS